MPSLLHRLLLSFSLLAALPASADALGVKVYHDPVVTHTNGMRLASTTSQRSHNAYWQCDQFRSGYCDGCMRGACERDWRSIGTRCERGYLLPHGPQPGPTSSVTYGGAAGLEPAGGERIGSIPVDADGPRMAAPAAAAAPSPPTGGVWLDTLQTLGEQMMQGADGL